MCIGEANIGCIGGDMFAVIGNVLDVVLVAHGVTVSVTRHVTDSEDGGDIYAEPQDDPVPFTVTLLVLEQKLDEVATIAGGKRNETVTLSGTPDTLRENDIVTYGGHLYDVRGVGRSTANSAVVAEVYEAVREVDM